MIKYLCVFNLHIPLRFTCQKKFGGPYLNWRGNLVKGSNLNSPNQIVNAGNAASVGHFTCHSNKFEFPETRAILMMMR